MDNTTDLLQFKISKAKDELPEISRVVVDSVNWKEIILGMNNKYNSEQLEYLDIETELLLCGLINTESYPKELETRMKISKNEVNLLLNELDRLIFKKMQEEVEDKINKEEKILYSKKPLILDPHFVNMPKDIQEAIADSDWKEKIYNLADKYKINIEQTGILEDITTKIMAGLITPSQYEDEVRSKIILPEGKTRDLIFEVNESVLVKIKEILKSKKEEVKEALVPLPPYVAKKEDAVPLPPPAYKKEIVIEKVEASKEIIVNKEVNNLISINTERESLESEISNLTKSIKPSVGNDIYKEHGIEILSEDEVPSPKAPIIKEIEKVEYREEIPTIEKVETITPVTNNVKSDPVEIPEVKVNNFDQSNIIANKLFNKTASQNIVTDYSIPKMNTQAQPFIPQGGAPTKPHDPYHEAI